MARTPAEKPYLDVKELQVDEWLELVFTPEKKRKFKFIDYEFPTDSHCHNYIASLPGRSDAEIKNLLRCFLIPTGGLGHDSMIFHYWCASDQLLEQIDTTEYGRRLLTRQSNS